jgi:hypothetical protein
MRSLLLATLSFASACASDRSTESHRVSETRVPVVAPARGELPVATPAVAQLAFAPAAAPAPAPAAAPGPREAPRRAAHDALVQYCGECHEAHRATAKPKALAVFDLDRPDWPSQFDDHKYQAAAMRLSSKSASARDAFVAFRDAERAATRPH